MGRSDTLGGPGRQGPDAGLPGAAPGPAGLKWRELTPCGWSSGSSPAAVLASGSRASVLPFPSGDTVQGPSDLFL